MKSLEESSGDDRSDELSYDDECHTPETNSSNTEEGKCDSRVEDTARNTAILL